jgi:ABC-type Mn2+/Zn2+ transport system permease subunit
MLLTTSGIVLGYAIFAGSALLLFHVAKVDPHSPPSFGFMALAVVYGLSFALLAGFIAGRVGGRHDLLSGLVLAGVVALGAIASMITRPGRGALWTQIAALVFFVPACAAGDWIRKKTRRTLGPR